ncbi:MAG: alanine racemase [Oligoflexia bacterium]|nr:alanine racemase [Oligoflexia bacterium]MBF0364467.1 alanine racemase [Oligoflexia bacterium]
MRFKTRLKVDLNILAENYQKIRGLAPNSDVLFVIKSNAYGLGMVPIVRYACNQLDIDSFGCASLGEAVFIRNSLTDLQFDLYVLSDLDLEMNGGIDYYLSKRLIPVISSLQKLEWILGNRECQHLPLCLKMDTGMNRLGIKAGDIAAAIALLKQKGRKEIYHMMSHFACSSQLINLADDTNQSTRQFSLFQKIKSDFRAAGINIERSSMANSGAIEQGVALREETHIRPGLLMYGLSALDATTREACGHWSGKNVSSLETNVIDFYPVKRGDCIGYGGATCPSNGTLVYIALGYGDGILNQYHKMCLRYKEHDGNIVGRISMDMSALLFPMESQKEFKIGDKLVLWDHSPSSLQEMAEKHGVIPYEILCNISDRVPRVYV